MSTPTNVFCSYAPEDEVWLLKLEKHLSLLKQQGLISLWHKRLISPGTDWAQAIDTHLETASIVLLFISADFFASDYQSGVEMKLALARQKAGKTRVIPLLVREVDWHNAPFAHLQVLPKNKKPLAKWQDKDSALACVATELRHLITTELPFSTAKAFQTVSPASMNIPYSYNPFFTGRENELEYLHIQLQEHNSAAIGQTQTISGLGGIGKTRLAIEYTYRYKDEYTTILWANAASQESLNTSYADIARQLNLSEKEEKEQKTIVQAVKDWLHTNHAYLLILDNADEPDLLVPFIPNIVGGHLLITTRSTTVRYMNVANPLILETLIPEYGALFLLHRAGLLALNVPLTHASQENQLQAQNISRELGGLPLALEQAAAYLENTGTDLTSYLQIYQQHRTQLLKLHQPLTYPYTVATTWNISFHKIEQGDNPAAADLLRFCAFLAPDAIPEVILSQGAEALGPVLLPLAGDAYLLNEAIATLRAYSLIARNHNEHTLSVHRLVQAVLRDNLDPIQRYVWAERVIGALNRTIPEPPIVHWQEWLPYLPQVNACAELIDEYTIVSEDAGNLLNRAGAMFRYYSRTAEAKKMYERALHIQETALGPEDPQTVTTLNNLAITIARMDKYEQALPLFEQVLHVRERILGDEHPDTVVTINDIALLYSRWHHFEESQHMYERALSIRERVLGPEHPDTATALVNISALYSQWKKYDQAQVFAERALHIHEATLGPEHSTTISTMSALADIYRLQCKYEQAEKLLQQVWHIQEQIFGDRHPKTATAINTLARVYGDQGAYEQAQQMYERALYLREQIFGVDNPNTTVTYFNMGQIYQKMGKYEQAEAFFLRALTTHEQALDAEHPKVANILEAYGELLHVMGQDEKARQMETRAQAIRSKTKR